MKIAAQLLAPYGRYLASVIPSQVDLATGNHGEGHKATFPPNHGLPSKITSSIAVIGRIFKHALRALRSNKAVLGYIEDSKGDPACFYFLFLPPEISKSLASNASVFICKLPVPGISGANQFELRDDLLYVKTNWNGQQSRALAARGAPFSRYACECSPVRRLGFSYYWVGRWSSEGLGRQHSKNRPGVSSTLGSWNLKYRSLPTDFVDDPRTGWVHQNVELG
jgi:hypothetical protein